MSIWILFFLIVSVIVLSLPFFRGSGPGLDARGPEGEEPRENGSEPF